MDYSSRRDTCYLGDDVKLTWEEFLYELSALGFTYSKADRSWRREDGAAASDEALRDLHNLWPLHASAALKLWSEGHKTVAVECSWENGVFISRLKAVE